MSNTLSYDVDLMREDMALKGLRATDLARRSGLTDTSVSRFFRGEARSAPTAKKLAKAIGYSVRRYLISSRTRKAVA